MQSLGITRDVWTLRVVVAVGVVLAPQLVIQKLPPQMTDGSIGLSIAGLVIFPVCLVATMLLYLHWRVTGAPGTDWVTACLGIFAVHGFVMTSVRLSSVSELRFLPGWEVILDICLMATLLGVAWYAERRPLGIDPMRLGVCGGLVVAATDVSITMMAPRLGLPSEILAGGHLVAVGLSVAVAVAISRHGGLPSWAGSRLAIAVVALGLARATGTYGHESALLITLALASGVVGALILCDTAMSLLGLAIRDDLRTLGNLNGRLTDLLAEQRAGQETMHEVKGTIAGIASATSLIRHEGELSVDTRHRLADMVEEETARLARLVTPGHQSLDQYAGQGSAPLATAPAHDVDLDTTIGRLVVAHQARGRDVRWHPSGEHVEGRSDEIAAVLNILIDNAAVHAPTSRAEIEVTRDQGRVVITVSDQGPGVAPAIRTRLFEWGAHDTAAGGQGIGLHMAHRLSEVNGASLHLDESAPSGARFVVGLRAAGGAR